MKIDPEHVYMLYIKHGVTPNRGLRHNSTTHCCALDILAKEELGKWSNHVLSDWAIPKFGYKFVTGFYEAFDSIRDHVLDYESEEYNLGIINGKEVRNYLVDKGFYSTLIRV